MLGEIYAMEEEAYRRFYPLAKKADIEMAAWDQDRFEEECPVIFRVDLTVQ